MLIDPSSPVPQDIHVSICSRLQQIPQNRACYTVLEGIWEKKQNVTALNSLFVTSQKQISKII